MRDFFLKVIINAAAISMTAWLLPGVTVINNDLGTLLMIGLVFGIVNALIKPILLLLTCPFVLMTLGLFLVVVNGLLLLITASFSGGRLVIDGLLWAVLGGIVMGIIGMILESVLIGGEDKQKKKN